MRQNGLILSVLLVAAGSGQGAVVWKSGFEHGFSRWSKAGGSWTISSDAHSGSQAAQISAPANLDSLLLTGFSTVGYSQISLSFWVKVDAALPAPDDACWFGWSTDHFVVGEALENFAHQPAGGWEFRSFELPVAAENNSLVNLHIWGRGTTDTGTITFDDVVVSGTPIVPEPATVMFVCSSISALGFRRRRIK